MAVISMNAEVIQKWDFTNGWSQATLDKLAANVAAGGDWTAETEGKSYQIGAREAGPLTVNTVEGTYEIPETKGLTFKATAAQHIVIVYNDESGKYPISYLWINGKRDMDQFVIHNVEPGQLITIDYDSHKNSESRGLKAVTSGVYVQGTTDVQSTTKERKTVVFETTSMEGVGDVTFQATNGFHIYSITVGTDEPGYDIGYVYNSSYPGFKTEDDMIGSFMLGELNPNHQVTAYDLATVTDLTAEKLMQHQLVVVGSAITGDEPQASIVRDAIAFVPMLNMTTNFYPVWGYGEKVATTDKQVIVGEAARNYNLFKPKDFTDAPRVEDDGTLILLTDRANGIQGYLPTEGSRFANDSVLATITGANAIHIHNMSRNAYLLLPYSYEDGWNTEENAYDFINNALNILATTKNDAVKAATPSINSTHKNMLTTVSLKCATAGASIFYTIDGSDPTLESTPYEAPFDITVDGTVVKAIAISEGFFLSDIATETIEVMSTATPPHFEIVRQQEGLTRVKLTCDYDNADIYYNYTGSASEDASALYTTTIDLKRNARLYAFVSHPSLVNSEVVEQFFTVEGKQIRIDTLALMDSNTKVYGSGDIVKAFNYYTENKIDSVSEVLIDFEGNVVKTNDGLRDSLVWTYTYAPTDSLVYKDFGNGWAVGSYGQRINNQGTGASTVIGTDYGPLTVDDAGASGGSMSFLVTKNATDPCSAFLQTTRKLQAPFDVSIWVASQSSVANVLEISVSPDSLEWIVVDTLQCQEGKKMRKLVTSYEGNDEVYVKVRSANSSGTNGVKTCLFDVLLQYNGPQSLRLDPSGIVETLQPAGELVGREVYSLDGLRLNDLRKGVNIIRYRYANGAVKTVKVRK